MKSISVLLAAIIFVSFTACGQKIDASKVPAAVKTSFAAKFPGAKVKWEKEDGKYEAGFTHQGHEMSALFQENGTMEESEMEINVTELPAAISAYITKHHPGVAIKEAAKITRSNGAIQYEAEVKGKDLIFDEKGNFLKETKD